jgi:hypothetical protein
MTSTHPCTPVGTLEVAGRLRRKPRTVSQWRHRNLLPEERWKIGGDPAWCWEHDIEPWARRTGRLPNQTSTQQEG